MSKDLNIITSGGSQLLTQIAVINYLNLNGRRCKVIYIGLQNDVLIWSIKLICQTFDLYFHKAIPNIPDPEPLKKWDFLNPMKIFRTAVNNKGIDESDLIPTLKDQDLILTFRQKMLGDAFIINAIKPPLLYLTADGVIDKPINRNLTSWKYPGIHTAIDELPISQKIYTPSYLYKDTEKVGIPQIIPDKILENCFAKMLKSTVVSKFRNNLVELGPKAIIFSQHFALNNNCSAEAEIFYYNKIVRDLIKRGETPILFKPHPRDTSEKIEILRRKFEELKGKVEVFSDNFNVLPIEIFYTYLRNHSVNLVTASSSACLCVNSNENEIISYIDRHLPKPLKTEIKNFNNRFKTTLRNL